jgi:hypothetical protein
VVVPFSFRGDDIAKKETKTFSKDLKETKKVFPT